MIVLLFFLAVSLHAQVASGVLLGEARDESGALAPDVQVTAQHEATGFSRSALTGADGRYRIGELLPGAYRVTAERKGFRTVEVRGVTIEVNQRAKLDLELKVGVETSSITVTGAISRIDTGDPSVGYRLNRTEITALPLITRNVISLATLGPGAIPRHLGGFTHDVINDIQAGRGAVALNPPINGARSTMNAYLLDGVANTDRNTFAIAVNPPMEAVQEFRIQSSLPGADFAQAGGGVVDVVTRAGSRQFHGSAFEYFRNEAVDARNFFDDPELPRPIYRQNQFGGSLGGPLPIPSTFFFATYGGLRAKSAKSSLQRVPDPAVRAGDFGGTAIFDPSSLDAAGRRRPFAGNRIPATQISSISRAFLDRYEPLPNRTGGFSNYLDATPNESNNHSVSGRIDHEFRDHSRVFGRYSVNEERGRIAGSFPVRATAERTRAQQAALAHTFAGRAWINEARFAFTRLRVFDVPESAFQSDVARELGISGIPSDPFNFGLPLLLVTNYSMVTDSPTLPQVQRDNIWNFSDSVSMTRGRHSFKAGFDWVRFALNYQQSRLARGQFIFTGALTAGAGGAGGDAFADFLLGFPQVTSRNAGDTQAYLRQHSVAGFFQDEWRASSRITLNLGMRYEYTSPFREARNNLLNLDYSTLPRAPRLARVASAVEPDRNNFAPRVGLAAQLDRNSVFRAGYGVYFSPEIAVESYDLIRNGVRNERNQTDGTRPILTLRDGFPQTAATGLPGYFGLDTGARTPYLQQWTASVQRQLAGRIVVEAAYVGSKGTKLGRFRTFNTPAHVETGENLAPRAGDLQSLRTFPELGQIIQRQHISGSSYHSLQFKAEKRLASRLAFLASFVWSKSIDDADSVVPGQFESFGAQDERNLRLERGLSFFDVGRRVSGGFVYELPSRGWLGPVLRDWRASGIVTLQDGTPLNPVYFAFDPANSGTPNRPDVVPGQKVKLSRSERNAERFFNTGAFRAPAPLTFGNAGRNILPGPGNAILDLAAHRRFRVHERGTIEFRVEFFNVFNHPNFGIPGPYPDFGPFFGKVFATGEPRRGQFALRFDF